MINIDNKFVTDFINDHISDIEACGTTFDYSSESSLGINGQKFLIKLQGVRRNIIYMTKEKMIKFVTDMKKEEVEKFVNDKITMNEMIKFAEEELKNDEVKNELKKEDIDKFKNGKITDENEMKEFVKNIIKINPYVLYWFAYTLYSLKKPKNVNFQKKGSDYIEFIEQLNKRYYIKISTKIQKNFEQLKEFALKKFNKIYLLNFNGVYKKIEKMFNYDTFCKERKSTSSDKIINLAYQFVKDSNLLCCPYCNRAFIETINENKIRTAELDHYFPQSIYPFFAISPWNLIPSCPKCNHVKRDPDTIKTPHLYPYELADSRALFFVPVRNDKESENNDLQFDFSNPKYFDIKIKIFQKELLNEAKNSKKIFHLEQLYQNNKKTVSIIYELLRFKGEDFLREVAQYFTHNPTKKNKIQAKLKEFINIKNEMLLPYGKDGILGKLSQDIQDYCTDPFIRIFLTYFC